MGQSPFFFWQGYPQVACESQHSPVLQFDAHMDAIIEAESKILEAIKGFSIIPEEDIERLALKFCLIILFPNLLVKIARIE